MNFPSAFFVFPGCFQHQAGGVYAAQPVGAAVPQPTRNITIVVSRPASACRWYFPSFSGKLPVEPANHFRRKGPGAMHLVGCRGETPQGLFLPDGTGLEGEEG